jgi:hypothetical protein
MEKWLNRQLASDLPYHFAAWAAHPDDDPARAVGFRGKDNSSLMLSFSRDEWRQLGELFDKALALPEVQDIFERFI